MKRSWNFSLLAVVLVALLTACAGERFTYVIDQDVKPSHPELPGLDGGPPRGIGVAVGPDGTREEFVVNEIMLHPKNEDELNEFLAKYGGTVLRDGKPVVMAGAPQVAQPESSGWYLIKVDLGRSSLEDIARNMEDIGLRGQYTFSTENAARLVVLMAREAKRQPVNLNFLLRPAEVKEHPDGTGGNLDAAMWEWMTEDDDITTPDIEDGISVGVIRAWRYLRYKNIPPLIPPGATVVWRPPIVAIVDSGFALDEMTGAPLDGNLDYRNSFNPPLQADIIDRDGTAGSAINYCPADSPCPYHGQGAFGVAAAYPRNLYGSAGTGGNVVKPMLIRIDGSTYNWGHAIRSAVLNGADVINISWAGPCFSLCRMFEDLLGEQGFNDVMGDAVLLAVDLGAVVVASAGNDKWDLDEILPYPKLSYPCEISRVICVGAIIPKGTEARKAQTDSNWGSNVDIWAPADVYSTVTPDSANSDCPNPCDNVGEDELYVFGGTSAAAPFVAGIVGLMKALDPSLRWDDVQTILQETVNSSPDSKVSPGYVDAYRAVERVSTDQPPTVNITFPSNGEFRSYSGSRFKADVSDPEIENMPAELRFQMGFQFPRRVVFSSNRDGQLCIDRDPPFECSGGPLSLGAHQITATATDAFDATASDTIELNYINHPPVADIRKPASGSTFRTHQTVAFGAYISDPEELPFPGTGVSWSSNLDGFRGVGWNILTSLSQGVHTITVTATDAYGFSDQDSITVNMLSGAGFPLAEIISPVGGFFEPGALITFEGEGTDPEDGTLPGTSLDWSSDKDGPLGTGNTKAVILSSFPDTCNIKGHTITLQVTDSDGQQSSENITVHVGRIC